MNEGPRTLEMKRGGGDVGDVFDSILHRSYSVFSSFLLCSFIHGGWWSELVIIEVVVAHVLAERRTKKAW